MLKCHFSHIFYAVIASHLEKKRWLEKNTTQAKSYECKFLTQKDF